MSQLPKGWVNIPITEACEFNPKKPKEWPIKENVEVSFVPMPAVDAILGVMNSSETRALEKVKKGYTYFENNDVLMAKITPCMENGKAAIARNLKNNIGFGSTEFHVFRDIGLVMSEYMFHFIRQSTLRSDAEAHMTGAVGQRRVPKSYFEKKQIPLPPRQEQEKIVKRLDTIFEQLNETKARLSQVTNLLKKLRQSLLDAACTGKLTEEWRSKNNIKQEWAKNKIVDLAKVKTGATPLKGEDKFYKNGTIPWVTSSVVNQDKVLNSDCLITELAINQTNAKILPIGTILLAMYGEGKTRGKFTELGIEAACNQALAGIILHDEYKTYKDFIKLNLERNYEQLRRKASGGVQPNLNLSIVKNIEVSLPSLKEVNEIQKLTKKYFSIYQDVFALVETISQSITKIESSVLKQAFDGRLVEQDPNDEPASLLIENIKKNKSNKLPKAAKPTSTKNQA